MDKREIIKIVLVNQISNEIENMYLEKQISTEVYRKIFKQQGELMETVVSAVGESFFDQQLDNLENANFLFLSKEILEDTDDSFNEKDIGFCLIDADNDVPEKYRNHKHINYLDESLLWNASNACVDKILEN